MSVRSEEAGELGTQPLKSVTAQVSAGETAERKLVLRPRSSAPQRAREFVAETISAWRLDGWQEPAVLITSELVTNAVRHAGTDLTVRIVRAPSEVKIEVADRAADRTVRTGAAGRDTVGGVGLVIVERLAAEWGVDRGPSGKSVWARLAVGAWTSRQAVPVGPAGQSVAASPYQSRHTTTASSSASADL